MMTGPEEHLRSGVFDTGMILVLRSGGFDTCGVEYSIPVLRERTLQPACVTRSATCERMCVCVCVCFSCVCVCVCVCIRSVCAGLHASATYV